MATEKVTFRVSWNEAVEARLTYLIDNGTIVLDPHSDKDDVSGKQELTISYDVPKSDIHRIEWLLWFPNKKLTGLVAVARYKSDKKFSPLNKGSGSEKENRWEDSGAL
ncbi:hypothetical protein BO221_31655 [Archangium sp. Cb G35]|uniref:hypothetical protein n=1 Tax=Archangium sp. Cb G35 TaxID=1920190 RepID=UPI00093635E5|nr:hypothetical protein [Archangium sp. Cb G35]OJT20549.1 hypothetical protein BO221_31655 [Archangium sp. Cb G35]